ncbi:MAG: sigma-70 family RNA polymerase sigma factor [Saprospirales bacterium]|nr:sigma-70 family RNA polymerase sigma factor [Saprospirales bacterium]
MCDCTSFIAAIREGGPALERALLDLINGNDSCGIKKLAFHVHRNYCNRCKNTFTWEDLLYETLSRFISAIGNGTEPRQKDCRPLLFQIAKHVCWEWGRKEKRTDDETETDNESTGLVSTRSKASPETPNFPIEDLAVLMKMVPELSEATHSCLKAIGKKDTLLLTWRFFQDEPVSDPQVLASRLGSEGFKVSPHVIPQEISNSKSRLRACLKGKLGNYYRDFNH